MFNEIDIEYLDKLFVVLIQVLQICCNPNINVNYGKLIPTLYLLKTHIEFMKTFMKMKLIFVINEI